MIKKMKKILMMSMISVFVLASCGGGDTEEGKEETKEQSKKTETKDEKPSQPQAVTIEIEGSDDMKFNKKLIKVKEGQEVTINLKHVGELPIKSMGHNWVLLKKDTDLDEFNMAAYEAGIENNHIPESDNIIAHTDLVGGGEQTSVTFTAPAKGKYTFICSFPGHMSMMKGTFLVS